LELKQLSNSRIFITGGTGPFGKAFLRYLDSEKILFKIFLLTRNSEKVRKFAYNYKNLDIVPILGSLPFQEKDFIKELPKVDFILHMASVTAEESFNKIDPLEKYLLLNQGTLDICNYGLHINAKRLLFTSSGCVYGVNNKKPINENNSLKVSGDSVINNSLAIGKISAEYTCNYFNEFKSLDTKIARCFSFCGLGMPTNLHYAIGNFSSQAIKGDKIIINGDGLAVRSYMDLDDLAIWLARLLFFDSNFNIYNFGSQEEISIISLAKLIKKISNSASEICVLNKNNVTLSNPERDYYVPNISRAIKDLSLSLKFNLECSISKYIKSLKEI